MPEDAPEAALDNIPDKSTDSTPVSNPWNNTTALIAVAFAFFAGLLGALTLRHDARPEQAVGESEVRAAINWRVPVAFGTNLPALGDNIPEVAENLRKASAGRVDLQVFEPGMLIPVFSITEGVRDNKIPAGYTWLGYDAGKIPATPLVSAVPFGMEPWEFTAWYYEDEGKALTQALYAPHQVHPILCGIIGPETAGWFRSPIDTLEDFQGLKIRFAGLGGVVLQKLGASVTMLPGGEIFQALEKGAIDATEFSLPVVDQMLGFDRVAKFNYFPGWHQTFTAAHLVVNQAVWAGLDPADQALIEMACTAGVIRNLSRAEALQGKVMAGFAAKGVTAKKFPRAILEQLREVTEQVLSEEAHKDPDFARIWASQKTFLATYRLWKDHAYLPRDF
ncbi:MAG: TRAP-type mannitol/chloroaromatic compound transport system substrate-binding protein [Candidatus Paceibacteria bacterium]|jgi:TRAP-type mannitol/chloroaromatic compound transport system substrate-binding protein